MRNLIILVIIAFFTFARFSGAHPNHPKANLNLVASASNPFTYIVPQHNTEFYVPLASNLTVDLRPLLKCKPNSRVLLTFIINDNKVAYFPPRHKIWPETNVTYVCTSQKNFEFESTTEPQHIPGARVLYATKLVLQTYENSGEIQNPYDPKDLRDTLRELLSRYYVTCAVSYYQFSRQDLDHLTDNSLISQTPFLENYPTPYPVSLLLYYYSSFVDTGNGDIASRIINSNANLWQEEATYEIYAYHNFTGGPSIRAYQLLGDFSVGDSFKIRGIFELVMIPQGSRLLLKINEDLGIPHNYPGYDQWLNKFAVDIEFDKLGKIHYFQSIVNFLPAIILSNPAVQMTPQRSATEICQMIMSACTVSVVIAQFKTGSGFPTQGAGQFPNQYSIGAGLNLVGGQQYESMEQCVAYLNTLPADSPPTSPNSGANRQCVNWHSSIAYGSGAPGSGDPEEHCIHAGQINLGPFVTPCF